MDEMGGRTGRGCTESFYRANEICHDQLKFKVWNLAECRFIMARALPLQDLSPVDTLTEEEPDLRKSPELFPL